MVKEKVSIVFRGGLLLRNFLSQELLTCTQPYCRKTACRKTSATKILTFYK